VLRSGSFKGPYALAGTPAGLVALEEELLLMNSKPLRHLLLHLLLPGVLAALVACAQPTTTAPPAPPAVAPPAAQGSSVPAAAAAAPSKMEEITFALNFLPVGDTAGWFAALDKGYYAENGLAVTIVGGQGGADTLKRIAAGRAEFGVSDMGTLVIQRLNEDVKVKAIAMYYVRSPMGIFFRKDSGIQAPRDLEGKNIACSAGAVPLQMFPAFANKAGVDPSKVNWQLTEPATLIPAFAARRADAVCQFVTSVPQIRAQVPEELGSFVYADYLDFYANALMTREETIAQNPDLVRRFTTATVRGLDYALKNPEEAVQILLKHAPENQPEVASEMWLLAKEFIVSPDTQQHGVGYMLPAKVAATYENVTAAYGLDAGRGKPEDLYTNDFLK